MSTKLGRSSRSWFPLTLLALGILGVFLLLFHTRNGPGITGDSVHYVMGAENILAGNGYSRTDGSGEFVPITAFPPGFSTALIPLITLGLEAFQAGRMLNAILFGVNIALVGILLYRYTGSIVYPLLGSTLVLLSEDLLHIHSWVMSEGLYIFLMLASIWALTEFLDDGHRWKILALGALVAAAILTRYIGVSLLGVGVLAILIFRAAGWKAKISEVVAFSAIVIMPLGLWFWRNGTVEGTVVNRAIAYHPISMDLILAALGTMNAWFFPLSLGIPKLIRGGISLLIMMTLPALFVGLNWRELFSGSKSDKRRLWTLPWVVLLSVPLYLLVLVLNSSFLDASTSLAGMARYLAPVFVAVVIYLLCIISMLLERGREWKWARIIAASAAVFLLVLYLARMVQFVSNPGLVFRYTDSKRNMPDVVTELESMDPGRLLISNDIELVYVLAGRPAHALPILFDHYIQREREDFDLQLALTKERLEGGAVIVFFGDPDPEEAEILHLLEVEPFQVFPGAEFLGIILTS